MASMNLAQDREAWVRTRASGCSFPVRGRLARSFLALDAAPEPLPRARCLAAAPVKLCHPPSCSPLQAVRPLLLPRVTSVIQRPCHRIRAVLSMAYSQAIRDSFAPRADLCGQILTHCTSEKTCATVPCRQWAAMCSWDYLGTIGVSQGLSWA